MMIGRNVPGADLISCGNHLLFDHLVGQRYKIHR
jgi:hypothetical protein